jgi:hypothetical protein
MATTRLLNVSNQTVPQNTAAHTQRTISSSAVNVLNHTLKTDTRAILVQFNGGSARVTFDGTSPTTSKGFIYADGATALWTPIMLTAAKGIRVTADVVVEIQELNYVA